MKRRAFLALLGGTIPLCVPAIAQRLQPIVGFLSSSSRNAEREAAFRLGLGVEAHIEYRAADSRYDILPSLLSELERSSVILAGGNQAALAVKTHSKAPAVFVVGDDPVALGLVQSLNKPGPRMTGITFHTSALAEKRLELLHQLLPAGEAITMLVNPRSPNASEVRRNVFDAAKIVGRRVEFAEASSPAALDSALTSSQSKGLFYNTDPLFNAESGRIIRAASMRGIVAVYSAEEMVRAGGLASYGAPQLESYRQAGEYVARILDGQSTQQLPVLQPTKFHLAINLKTAKAQGINIPATLLVTADEVLE